MSKYIFGIFIILIGAYFLLANLGYEIGLGEIIKTYWPILVIAYGLKVLINGLSKFVMGLRKKNWSTSSILLGIIYTGIGVIILGNNLNWFALGLKDIWNLIWPLLIIYFGLNLIFKKSEYGAKGIFFEKGLYEHSTTPIYNKRRSWVGESKYGVNSTWVLEDLQLWHGIGETFINLETAIIQDRETFIEIDGWLGEVTIRVPHDLAVSVNVDLRLGEVTVFNHKQSGSGRFIAYKSANYAEAARKVNIMVSLRVGEVTVKQVD